MGHWMMWDALLNSRGHSYNSRGYSDRGDYGNSYDTQYGGRREDSGVGFLPILFGLLLIGVLLLIGWIFYRKHSADVARNSPLVGNPSPSPASAQPGTVPEQLSPAMAEWITFPPGSFVVLSDSQSMDDSKKRGDGYNPIRYAVQSVGVATDIEGLATWALVHLDDRHQKLLLLVKCVNQETDYRLYYASEDFKADRREDVVERGDRWLFDAPKDESALKVADLRYGAELVLTIDGNALAYVNKQQGERHANYTETPSDGNHKLLATIVEYSTADDTENPELLIVEIGAASRRTGEIALYLGCSIRESEIDLLKAKASEM